MVFLCLCCPRHCEDCSRNPPGLSVREKSHICSYINRERKSLLPLSVFFPTQKKHPNQQQPSTQVCGHRRVTKSLEVAAVNQASNCSQLKSSPPLSHSLVQYAKQQQQQRTNLILKRTEDFCKSRESRTILF